MRDVIRQAVVLGSMVLAVLAPRAASAITLDQIVSLAKSGVTDTVILALIDRDRTVFAIEPEQILSLQRNGLSEKVIVAMLKSGRFEGEQAARADAASNSAWIASNLLTEPETITVGHGPDRPNTPHIDGFYSGPPVSPWFAEPYRAPSFRYRTPAIGSRRSGEPSALCYANVTSGRASSQVPFVTACPEIMQPRRPRR
jgi:hypothetical protein